MALTDLINNCKMSMRITTDAYNDEILAYIEAAKLDLKIAGVEYATTDNLVNKAIMTYVRMSFGSPSNYEELKASYDEQKAQLMNATGYTNWGA